MSKIRPLDYVLALLMTAGGVFLMAENMAHPNESSLVHPDSTTTWAMIPVFLLVTVPILFRRVNVLAVVGVTVATTALHVALFGWETRCGVEIPLGAALAYAVARFSRGKRDHLLGLAGILALFVVMLWRDSSAGFGGLTVAIPGAALFYGAGLLVQNLLSRRAAEKVAPAAEHATI